MTKLSPQAKRKKVHLYLLIFDRTPSLASRKSFYKFNKKQKDRATWISGDRTRHLGKDKSL
jgi:hypothetical protein